MTPEIRATDFASAAAHQRLSGEAFGYSPPEVTPEAWPPANVRPWSAWDGDEMVANLEMRSFDSWFHGSPVPTAGVAGVTAAAEHRGRGVLRPLVDRALADAREQGAAVSTLYPTAAGIYRGLGYEIVGSYDAVRIPLAALARMPHPAAVRARRGTPVDLDALRAVYASWASVHNGPITRTDEPFARDASMFDPNGRYTGVTLAIDGDEVLGYAAWSRGSGYDGTGTIKVRDLIALTPDAARALWRVLASFHAVAGTVVLSTSGGWTGTDLARLVLPDHRATVTSQPYMLRLLDVPGALGAAQVAPVTARVPFGVADPAAPDLAGSWLLEAADGAVRVSPGTGDDGRLVFTSGGLAASYAGALPTTGLRRAGMLTGPTTYDAAWDALWRGRDVHIRDYF